MAFSYRLLVDENVEPIDADLRAHGHDIERVGETPRVDYGADDRADIVPYLHETERVLLTYDGHFTGVDSVIDPTTLPGVLFIPDESLSPNQIVRIVTVISEHTPPGALKGRVQHVTRNWLRYEE